MDEVPATVWGTGLDPETHSGGAPVSILVDYDGTISCRDVGDELVRRFVDDQAEVARLDTLYDEGRVGSRDLMRWDMNVLPDDPALLQRAAAVVPQDETFVDLVATARKHGGAVEVVSDGLGFYVVSKLARLGIHDVPVATNRNTISGRRAGLDFPFGHPHCFVCGTCKRERVRAHQAIGRIVVFVGDGTSDRYAAWHADVVFAKGSLARFCEQAGWSYRTWTRLSEIAEWLDRALDTGELPRSDAEASLWADRRDGRRPAFICGPEVWGDDRTTPSRGWSASPD